MKIHKTHILALTAESVARETRDLASELTRIEEFDTRERKGFYENETIPFNSSDVWIAPRQILEHDERFRQLIPYVILHKDGEILVYERTSQGGESRLHNKLSIGFGGHIDISDVVEEEGQVNLVETVGVAALREIQEELEVTGLSDKAGIEWIIAKNENEVDKVHVGLVLLVKVTGEAKSNESAINLLGFKTFNEIADKNIYDRLESWSQIIVDKLKDDFQSLKSVEKE